MYGGPSSVLASMWVASYLVLLWPVVLFSSVFSSAKIMTVFNFRPHEMENSEDDSYLKYNLEATPVTAFTICFYFKPAFQLNPNSEIILEIPELMKIGIYKDSAGGWLEIGKENIIFDFPTTLYPRHWNGFCVQQTQKKRKIWHENQLIFDEKVENSASFNIQVLFYAFMALLTYVHLFLCIFFFCLSFYTMHCFAPTSRANRELFYYSGSCVDWS